MNKNGKVLGEEDCARRDSRKPKKDSQSEKISVGSRWFCGEEDEDEEDDSISVSSRHFAGD